MLSDTRTVSRQSWLERWSATRHQLPSLQHVPLVNTNLRLPRVGTRTLTILQLGLSTGPLHCGQTPRARSAPSLPRHAFRCQVGHDLVIRRNINLCITPSGRQSIVLRPPCLTSHDRAWVRSLAEHLATPTGVEEQKRNLLSHDVGNHGRGRFHLDCAFGHQLHQLFDNLHLLHL